jgi:hypothetical protein
MRTAFLQVRVTDGIPPREHLRQVASQLNGELEQDLERLLLPHQSRRLRQLELQLRLRVGLPAVFTNPQLVQQLGLASEQREALERKIEQVEREVRRQLMELRQRTQRELMAVLTPAQQEEFQRLVGEPFDFVDQAVPAAASGRVEGPHENPE